MYIFYKIDQSGNKTVQHLYAQEPVFHPDLMARVEEVTDTPDIAPGWVWEAGAWVPWEGSEAEAAEQAAAVCWVWPCLAFQEALANIAEGVELALEQGIQANDAYSEALLSIRNRLLGAHEVVTGPADSMDSAYLKTLTALDGLVAFGLLTEEQKAELLVPYEGE